MNLLESAGGKGDSDSDEDDEVNDRGPPDTEKNTTPRLPNPLAAPPKLPSPALGTESRAPALGSVFVNSYQRAEEAKHSILEQHVKMTTGEVPKEMGSGRKVCWNFRKGKCRFGHKCRYAHDSDLFLNKTEDLADLPNEPTASNHGNPGVQTWSSPAGQSGFHGKQVGGGQYGLQSWQRNQQHAAVPDNDDDSYMAQTKRKKRSGVAANLVPPKKAMEMLGKQRAEERPWTMNR